ncbi:hypothetical protein [Bradyrhizobium diazoefficiens]|uniref:Uncharacterized protein n=1 Tax=Bradyrhizobium diazoefficiens TaxID=1355477 RepID=A0A809WUE4_9BRAD|nr:hypothetical protein XF1B_04890 [Bradyrhizobium diazoefficiens]BCF22536.1 hypothetical protein XF14B_04880 [Bradyrhizobium diazoefficiens]
MNLFELTGTVTALGQSAFDNDVAVYAYLEVTDRDGGRTMIEKVAVCNDVAAAFGLGCSGTFYIDRLFSGASAIRCQLFGLRNDRIAVLDRVDLREKTGLVKVGLGILTLPIIGLGLLLLLPGIHLLWLSARHDRRKFFYAASGVHGTSGAMPPPLPVAEVARI